MITEAGFLLRRLASRVEVGGGEPGVTGETVTTTVSKDHNIERSDLNLRERMLSW